MLPLRIMFAVFCGLASTNAGYDVAFESDDDLSRFVTRPEIRAPLFEVDVHEPAEVTPGYWFVAPYANIVQERHPSKYYQSCQTGPAIYDASGELVWSGACLVKNQNTCDFRAFTVNGSVFLSAILTFYPTVDAVGRGIILDSSMRIMHKVQTPNTLIPFNMHEFNVLHNGKTAVHIVQKVELADLSHIAERTNVSSGLVVNMGIREFDLESGQTVFTWWANDHINLNASGFVPRHLNGPYPNGWDWIHLNAIDKNYEGDYLVTGRYTDAVYKISGRNGSVLWSLGGTTSSFQLAGFGFSRPHDARFVSREGDVEIISLLDNGGCEESKSSEMSSALVVRLDKSSDPWKATVQQRWTRPDGGRSDKRGNFQLLPNGNAFVGWSENSYISEHSPDGRLLMEAQFSSERFVTYRAYKFNFTSTPSEPPVLKGFAFGESPGRSVSVYYVSWNGATEVANWEFYSETGGLLGTAGRSGFETMFQQSSHYARRVYAQAMSGDGVVLGTTEVETIENPAGWSASGGISWHSGELDRAGTEAKTEL